MPRNTPPETPQFLCTHCRQTICTDCASTAAEYEFLYARLYGEIASIRGQMEDLKRNAEQLEHQAEMWQSLAKAPFPAVVQAYMDNEMKKARELGRKDAIRRARKSGLLDAIEKLEGKN